MNALLDNAYTDGWASIPVEGFDGGSISMLTVRIG